MYIEEKISNCLYDLSISEIESLEQTEQGGVIGNVLNGLESECYSLIMKDEDYENAVLRFSLIFIGEKENAVKGYILEDIDFFDNDRDDLTLGFSIFLEQQFTFIDRIDAFNTYQSHLRSVLEKLKFFTYTQDLLNKIQGRNPTIILKSRRGAVFIPMINKIEAYQQLFKVKDNSVKDKTKESIDYVYLFFNGRNNLTKIGTSKKPVYRERTLQGQEPIVEVIAKWGAPKKIERELHKIFKEKRKRGEWFALNTKDYNFIAEYMLSYELAL